MLAAAAALAADATDEDDADAADDVLLLLLAVVVDGDGDDWVEGVDDGDVLKLPICDWCWRMFVGVGEDIADEVDEDPPVDFIDAWEGIERKTINKKYKSFIFAFLTGMGQLNRLII